MDGPAKELQTELPAIESPAPKPVPLPDSDSGSNSETITRARRPSPSATTTRGGRRFSRLTLSIIALNIFPVATLLGGLLYVGSYERSLIQQELVSLGTQARIFTRAMGETAIPVPSGPAKEQQIDVRVANWVIKQLVTPTRVRVRIFKDDGAMIADTRKIQGRNIREEKLPAPQEEPGWLTSTVVSVYDWFFLLLSSTRDETPLYIEKKVFKASDFSEVMAALKGDSKSFIRRSLRGHLILSYAVPVQRYKKVYGALLVSISSQSVDANVRETRLDIMQIFAVILFTTLLLSFYLSRSIARPINRLAAAAEAMRRRQKRSVSIPDFTHRRDEIGDLSGALRDLTSELWARLDAIEGFAADVSHEIKNPLSSVRSAVETAAKVSDPERQKKLLAVIQHDVERLDRLITDISRSSRLDAEMSRVVTEPVDIAKLLTTLVDVHEATTDGDGPRLLLNLADEHLFALAVEDRIMQVFQNLIQNAVTFSPPDGEIRISAWQDGNDQVVTIEDQGPGIPEGKLEAIFDRFYTERPAGEAFGNHSGLGLSISRQIVDALGGDIFAENLSDEAGTVVGARFVIRLSRSR
jgi:two-component system sensor histidine kinase ChvG